MTKQERLKLVDQALRTLSDVSHNYDLAITAMKQLESMIDDDDQSIGFTRDMAVMHLEEIATAVKVATENVKSACGTV